MHNAGYTDSEFLSPKKRLQEQLGGTVLNSYRACKKKKKRMPQEWKLLSHLKNKLKLETLGNPILQTMKEEEKERKKSEGKRKNNHFSFLKERLFYLLKILLIYLEGKETHTHSSSSLLP